MSGDRSRFSLLRSLFGPKEDGREAVADAPAETPLPESGLTRDVFGDLLEALETESPAIADESRTRPEEHQTEPIAEPVAGGGADCLTTRNEEETVSSRRKAAAPQALFGELEELFSAPEAKR